MTKTQILWTILPYGMIEDKLGNKKRQVSVVVSPRLTPDEQNGKLEDFTEFLDWPGAIAGATFTAEIANKQVPLTLISTPNSDLWQQLFTTDTPVEGFKYMDMSKVKLRSYQIRNILGNLKKTYAKLAVESPLELPQLLPWTNAHPVLKDMLGGYEEGVTVLKNKCFFERLFDKNTEEFIDNHAFGMVQSVPSPFAEDTGLPKMAKMELRVMDPDWKDDQTFRFCLENEYDFYQADRFYRRSRPTEWMRRPNFEGIAASPTEPEYDFHSIVAALASYPELMRQLGLLLDFVLDESPSSGKLTAQDNALGRLSVQESRERPLEPLIPSMAGSEEGRLRLQINWPVGIVHDSATDVTPWTAFFAGPECFITRSRTEDHVDGLLNLKNSDDSYNLDDTRSPFDIYQVDPDGAALKTVNFILTGQNLFKKPLDSTLPYGEVTYTTGDRQGLAALRSGGLGVSRHQRAVNVAMDVNASKLKNDALNDGKGNEVTLFAEDVLRGYRVDVAAVPDKIKSGTWHKLCARIGNYHLMYTGTNSVEKSGEDFPSDSPLSTPIEDEGYVSGASTTSGGPDSCDPDDHYLHESLFRWTGWSLCTPRPGKAIKDETAKDDEDGGHIQYEVPCDVEDEAANGCGVSAKFTTPPRSLPRLRFGQLYRFRARIVDLAGNSLSATDRSLGEFTGASNAVGYYRFEPIDPPVIVHRTRVSEGESLERMVIRSNHNLSTKEYRLDTEKSKLSEYVCQLPDSWDFDYCVVNERHFVPPKSSQQQCEMHGLFDPYFGNWERIKDGYEIAARDEGTLNDNISDDSDAPVKLITPKALEDIATTKDAVPQLVPSEDNPLGDRMVGGQYVIHGEEQLVTPWLPDGAAEGVAIRAVAGHKLPGVTEAKSLGDSCIITKIPDSEEFVILVKHGESWPDSRGFRLILDEQKTNLPTPYNDDQFTDEPVWNEGSRTLTFFVQKGWIVRLVYSSYANQKFINSFGIPQWVANDADRALVCKSAMCGANWLITPFRELTLVHATQQPVWEPQFKDSIRPYRDFGTHDVKLSVKLSGDDRRVRVSLHRHSTSKFEVEAEWSEWVDDPTKLKPERVQFKGQLGEIKLVDDIKQDKDDEFFNTFKLNAAVDAQWSDLDEAAQKQRGDVHALGDTRFRLIKYRLCATTRFREYLPPSIYERSDNVTQAGPFATGDPMLLPANIDTDPGAPILPHYLGSNQQSRVLASAPPADPRVLYVVPTMRWDSTENADVRIVNRFGNSLRVWLDRPWFSSGDGELLGVVIFENNNGAFKDIPDAFQQLVTQWGVDPFWKSTSPLPQAKAADFSAKVTYEGNMQLQEKSDSQDPMVTIVGHRVHWDNDRKLWYCDIEITPNLTAYMPFVRLALVRYQPNAIEKAKISKVVLTDFAQVIPDRRVTVVKSSVRDMITVALYGSNPLSGPMMSKNESSSWYKVDDVLKASILTACVNGDGRNRVELVLQTRDPAIDSDLAWTDDCILYNKVVDTNSVQSKPFCTIAKSVSSVDNKQCRLMLREFERFYSDDTLSASSKFTYPATGPVQEVASTERVIEERLVFAYIIPLS